MPQKCYIIRHYKVCSSTSNQKTSFFKDALIRGNYPCNQMHITYTHSLPLSPTYKLQTDYVYNIYSAGEMSSVCKNGGEEFPEKTSVGTFTGGTCRKPITCSAQGAMHFVPLFCTQCVICICRRERLCIGYIQVCSAYLVVAIQTRVLTYYFIFLTF